MYQWADFFLIRLPFSPLVVYCCLKIDAMISPVHANFLVNMGMATATDVKLLMDFVISRVKKESGIELQTEVHFL